jgi:hypothetical protein
MNLGARLAKLEQRTMGVLRCAWCRYSLVNVDDGGGRGRGEANSPEAFVWKTCRWCGNRYRQMLPDLSPREREALLLWYHTFDGETYRDERAYAAQRWWSFRWSKLALAEEAVETEALPAANPAYRGNYGRGKVERLKESRAVRERRELKEAATEQLRKARAREERLYGPRIFPLVETLKELGKDCAHYAHLYDKEDGHQARSPAEIKARQLLAYARCMEACELVLLGGVEPETRAEIEARTAEADVLREKRLEEKREKEEREKREREEREHERLERLEAQKREERRRASSDFWLSESAGDEPQQRKSGVVMIPEIPPEPSETIPDIIARFQESYRRAAQEREAEESERRYLRRYRPR